MIRPVPGDWHSHTAAQLDEDKLADWRAGRAAVYQLAALTIEARMAVANAQAAPDFDAWTGSQM